MLKICSGIAKGVILKCPRGMEVRPTSGRVRQAIFSGLGDRICGSFVLDLYAGTGAMGIEALSRGAAGAVFVEISRRCLRTIRENLELTHLSERGKVIGGDALRIVRRLGRGGRKFDVVIADPPYEEKTGRQKESSLVERTLKAIVESDILRPDSVVVLEHLESERGLEAKGGLSLLSVKRYGGTSVSIFGRMKLSG